jgi:hypothetical protein
VDLAAVVTAPCMQDLVALSNSQPVASEEAASRCLYAPRMPILGNDVLCGWVERVRKLGVKNLWLVSSPREEKIRSVLGALARQGVERFLMIKLKSYAEMDLADLIRFHCQRRNTLTEVRDSRGDLGVSVLNHSALRTDRRRGEYRAPRDRERSFYAFRGYAKRILSARERQDLVGDALTGTCAMRPLGEEIRQQVWIGEGASLASSARVIGPSYIGARTVIRAGATVGPFASVEQDCVVECGTTLERATVLPRTHLASGLLIRNALVDGSYLKDLESGIVADLEPGGLADSLPQPAGSEPASTAPTPDEFTSAEGYPLGSSLPITWRDEVQQL